MFAVASQELPASTSNDFAGAERILHRDSWWNVMFAEQQPTLGRVRSSLRVTVALAIALLLAALIGQPEFVLCPITALTELQPGIGHSPKLLLKRIGVVLLIGVGSVMLVAAFPQNPAVLFAGILGTVWFVLYAAKVLPVGSSGQLVAMWALTALLAKPLSDPTEFELVVVYTTAAVSAGAVISYLCAVFVFPGVEIERARVAADGLLAEAQMRLSAIAKVCTLDVVAPTDRAQFQDLMSPAVLAHIATLTTEVATYTNEPSNFPQLAPITRLASLSDSAALHLTALARETENPEVRAAIAAIATALTQAFEQSRTATLAAHWARTSDASHELDALIRKTESIIAMGEEILERDGSVPDDELATVAGFAFRVGKSLRVVLTERPLPARFGEATLALPLGFPAASPLGNTATISSLFQRLDHGAALSALATVVGLALSLVATAVFLPIATSPAAIGAVAVMQSTVGAVGRRGLLRFVGTFIGAIMTFVAVTIFASGAQDLGSYLIIMSVMSFISAWVMVGSPRTSYVGFMMGAAFIVGIASDSAAPSSLQLVVDRVLSVVLACACVSTVLMVFHLRSSRLAVMESIGDGWTLIAQLIRGSQLHDFTEAELQTFRTLNQRATSDLALTAELREQHAFENTLRIGTFLPMLTMLAEQQRSLLLVRSLGSGRFHETLPPSAVSELLDAPVRSLAAHFERLGGYFRDGASVDASLPFAIPSAAQLRACAVEHGCDAAMVARLLYRREVIGLMEQTAARAQFNAQRGFIWKDQTLYCAMEVTASGRTIAEVVGTLSPSTT